MLVWLDSNSNLKGHAQRELCPRGDGAVQPRRRPLHREGHPRGRPRLHRLAHRRRRVRLQRPLPRRRRQDRPRPDRQLERRRRPRILLKQPACAEFLVRKLYRYFVSELQEPPAKLLEPLAERFRKSDYDIARSGATHAVVAALLLRPRLPAADQEPGGVRPGRACATVVRRPDRRRSRWCTALELMGQQLFAPPNVKGWPGGQAWLNTSTVLARSNFAQALAMGDLWNDTSPRRSAVRADGVRAAGRCRRPAGREAARGAAAAGRPGRRPG